MTEPTSGEGNLTLPKPEVSGLSYTSLIAGNSLTHLHSLILDFTKFDENLLFVGERGTGKEMFADFYIQESLRKDKFKKINCAGIADNLLRSELFGHERGAFTDASDAKDGFFTSVGEGGGIFLDELGDASKEFHAAILRVIQSGDYFPLGSVEQKKLIDVKIIAATSKLNELRKDLQDRFIILYIPPLYKRKEDIPLIIRRLWHDTKSTEDYPKPLKISRKALIGLKNHNWPGNVRELSNALDLALVLSRRKKTDTLTTDVFPTIPHLSECPEPDESKQLLIQNLRSDSKPLPFKEFLTPLPDGDSEKLPKINGDFLSDLSVSKENTFNSIIPKQYTKEFWEYYARKGYKPPYIVEKFNNEIKESTARQNLRYAKKRLNQPPTD